MERIDSHHHFWEYDPVEFGWLDESMANLRRDFLPSDLQAALQSGKVDGAITVQARQIIEETNWILNLADKTPEIRGVVGWVPLCEKEGEPYLEKYSQNQWLKGVRHVVQAEADDAFILRKDFNAGIKRLQQYNLAYDVLILAKHLENTVTFVDQHPDQIFVLDHIAKPSITADVFDSAWKSQMSELAKRPHISCKISGVVTEVQGTKWTPDLIRPYLEHSFEVFGADRVLFGSDWPVCECRTTYAEWIHTLETATSAFSTDERKAFWGGNAKRIYQL